MYLDLNNHEEKTTVRLPSSSYQKVRSKLVRGQLTRLMSIYIDSLAEYADNDAWNEVIDFLYKHKSLVIQDKE